MGTSHISLSNCTRIVFFPFDSFFARFSSFSGSGVELRLLRLLHFLGRPLVLFIGGVASFLSRLSFCRSFVSFCRSALPLFSNTSSSISTTSSTSGPSPVDQNTVAVRPFSVSLILRILFYKIGKKKKYIYIC